MAKMAKLCPKNMTSFLFLKEKGKNQYVKNCYFQVANDKNCFEEFDGIQSDFNDSDGKKA